MKLIKQFVLFVFIFLLSILSQQAVVANAETPASLILSPINVRQDEDFTTTLTIAENAQIYDFQIELNYDTDLVTLVSAKENKLAGNVIVNTDTAGAITVTYSSSGENIEEELEILDLTFHVDANAGCGAYELLWESDTFTKNASRLEGAALVDIELQCDFEQLKIYEPGDTDLNLSITVRDASILRRYLAQLPNDPELTEFHLRIADAEADGVINMRDPSRIQRHVAKFTGDIYGDRVNIKFYDVSGNLYATRSVLYGGDLSKLPAIPEAEGYSDGKWSASANAYVEPVFTDLQKELSVYVIYGEKVSEAITFYKQRLTDMYYSGDLQSGLSSDLSLTSTLSYQNGYTASIIWASSNNAVLNSTTGLFNKPTYPTDLVLTAKIISYNDKNAIEAEDEISFTYNVKGEFITPTKETIANWIEKFFNVEAGQRYINYNLRLPQSLDNEDVGGSTDEKYEVRIQWTCIGSDGVETPIVELKRTQQQQLVNLVATVTSNGVPLEGDGKIYVDDVTIEAITQFEIKSSIINQIGANMGLTLSNGTKLWNDDQVYDTNITWISQNNEIATIENNEIAISSTAINGTALPLTAEVSYEGPDGPEYFTLSYTVNVVTDNSRLVPGPNIQEALYDAIKEALYEATGFSGDLTTEALRDNRFVTLDLSEHTEITSLKGLSYCTNLHVLNISGLKITDGSINEVATLSKLEAFIARDCGLDNLSDGGVAVLKNAINLRMLDLSENNFTSLDSVLDSNVLYGKLFEVYVSDNKLEDISALNRAPAMHFLSLADNGLTSEDLEQVSKFTLLNYLSLANNEITDLSALENLRELRELRLHNNQITDVKALRKLINLQALYLGHNEIASGVEFLANMTELQVLYLNDNKIQDISALNTFDKLVSINVSNNELTSLSVLSNYTGTLEEIYAENNDMTGFGFIQNASNLRILMLAGNGAMSTGSEPNMSNWLSGLTKLEALTLSGIPLEDLSFLSSLISLKRLDVAGCGLNAYTGEVSNLASIAECYSTLKILDISHNNFRDNHEEIMKLQNLSNLVVLYADDICDTLDVAVLINKMSNLRYLSLERCGITSVDWLSRCRKMVYIDLADNNIAEYDLNVQISHQTWETVEYLYLDTNVPCTFADVYNTAVDNVLKKLSLQGVSIGDMKKLPDLNNIEYLNLSNTDLTNLQGSDPDFYDIHSIERYQSVETLDVTGVQADLTPVANLANLKILYAVGTPEDRVMHEASVHALQNMYNKGVTCYLYDTNTVYEPVAMTEGTKILDELEDYSCDIIIAADGIISDNNPVLQSQINDFDITWSISNEDNYQIVDHRLAVKDYTNIKDESLTLTAQITVYPDQTPVTRSYTVNTTILRAADEYYEIDTFGLGGSDELVRETEFTYDVLIKAAYTEGFTQPVKPIVDEVRYSYDTVLEDGNFTPYPNALTVGENHNYVIAAEAPLGSVTTITVQIGHNLGGEFVVDDSLARTIKVAGRTFTITYVTNGGEVISNSDNAVITSQSKSEDATLFQDITVKRTGYLFEGWYVDEALEQLYWKENDVALMMPAEDITVYAKWTPHSFNVNFDANGGSVSETSRLVLCDEAFGELPVPTRDYYTFNGWFTAIEGGTQIAAETTMATATDITVYAQWTRNAVSGWVLASQMPADAQVVNQKWSYTETLNMESTNTSVTGYTQIGSYWVQSGSGSVNYSTSFPGGFDTSHWIYTSFAKGPYSAYENTTNKRVVSNNWAGYVYWHWMYNCGSANGTSTRAIYNQYGTGRDNGFVYKYFGAFTSTNGNYSSSTYYCNSLGIVNYVIPERTAYADCQGSTRWFRFDYYVSSYTDYYKMFQYQKVENKESASEVTASDKISNVQKWVQYRAK